MLDVVGSRFVLSAFSLLNSTVNQNVPVMYVKTTQLLRGALYKHALHTYINQDNKKVKSRGTRDRFLVSHIECPSFSETLNP